MAPTIGNSTSPSGCQVRGDVCCRSADWTDVTKFFIANYITHAFTVVATPGARKRDTILFVVWALFNPFVGVGRAFGVIARCASWSKDDLHKAHKAGALYTLVKLTRDNNAGKITVLARLVEHLDHFPIYVHGAHPTFSPGWRKLYYPVQLPFDYIVSRIPTPTRIHASMSTNDHEISAMNVATQTSPEELQSSEDGSGNGPVTLSSNRGVVKAGVAIFQVLYGSWELYIARGRQFERYGYTAFSLTLVPYIAMSLLNLLATIFEPQYPCVFLVQHGEDVSPGVRGEINDLMGGAVAIGKAPSRNNPSRVENNAQSDTMDDIWYGDHSIISGIRTNSGHNIKSRILRSFGVIFRSHPTPRTISLVVFATVLAIGTYLAPFIVAFILTRFDHQQSTRLQRQWITFWLMIGELYGTLGLLIRPTLNFSHWSGVSLLVAVGACIVPGIGVWVFAAKMILEGGICKIM